MPGPGCQRGERAGGLDSCLTLEGLASSPSCPRTPASCSYTAWGMAGDSPGVESLPPTEDPDSHLLLALAWPCEHLGSDEEMRALSLYSSLCFSNAIDIYSSQLCRLFDKCPCSSLKLLVNLGEQCGGSLTPCRPWASPAQLMFPAWLTRAGSVPTSPVSSP